MKEVLVNWYKVDGDCCSQKVNSSTVVQLGEAVSAYQGEVHSIADRNVCEHDGNGEESPFWRAIFQEVGEGEEDDEDLVALREVKARCTKGERWWRVIRSDETDIGKGMVVEELETWEGERCQTQVENDARDTVM